MRAPLAFPALALLVPGCVAAVPVAPYVAGAATTVAATYVGDSTFDYAGRRLRVEQMDCDDLAVAYAHTLPRQSILVNSYTDWLTTRGMMEEHAEARGCPLPQPAPEAERA